MSAFLLREILKSLDTSRQKSALGYTLVELLVIVVSATIVITSLLVFVVNLLQYNERELSRTETQREMEIALDFISEELREAVHIYTGAELDDRTEINGVADNLNLAEGLEPILVFWKPDNFDRADLPNCETLADAEDQQECRGLAIALRTYTLVVYTHDTNPADTWSGRSQIRRFELTKYQDEDGDGDLDELARSDGYVDPVANDESSFQNWPFNANGDNLQDPGPPTINRNNATNPVLVDFVDASDATLATPNCEAGYGRTPSSDTNNAFYACVRDVGGPDLNQDVFIYLRGNPLGRTAYSRRDYSAPLPTLQTQVITRGVIGRNVN